MPFDKPIATCPRCGNRFVLHDFPAVQINSDLLEAAKKAFEWFGEGAEEYHILKAAIERAEKGGTR